MIKDITLKPGAVKTYEWSMHAAHRSVIIGDVIAMTQDCIWIGSIEYTSLDIDKGLLIPELRIHFSWAEAVADPITEGSKVMIRDDLEPGKLYGGISFLKGMQAEGILTVDKVIEPYSYMMGNKFVYPRDMLIYPVKVAPDDFWKEVMYDELNP